MKLVDEELLEVFRRKTVCECCRKPAPDGCDPAHVYSRGAGRVDVPENLVALKRSCHQRHHDGGYPTVKDLELIVALRMGILPEDIKSEVDRIRRLPQPKDSTPKPLKQRKPKEKPPCMKCKKPMHSTGIRTSWGRWHHKCWRSTNYHERREILQAAEERRKQK